MSIPAPSSPSLPMFAGLDRIARAFPLWGGHEARVGLDSTAPTQQRSPAPPPPSATTLRERVQTAASEAAERIFSDTRALEDSPPSFRKHLKDRIVELALLAAELRDDEAAQDARLQARKAPPRQEQRKPPRERKPVASALAAGDQFSGVAAERGASQLQALREAIDFPTYVQSLIFGVFTAITRSNISQLESLGTLLDGVSATSSTFASQNVTDGAAARWVVQRFPGLFAIVPGENESAELRLANEEVDLFEHLETLTEGLEATEDEVSSIDDQELAETLIPLARRKMGRDKQAMLATMVMLGLQRVVVDRGQLHASMDMRVDTRSVSEQRQQERFDSRVNTSASASVGAGPWAASASVSASIGYVRSDDQFTQEELASQAGLRSSVDLVFRTEQVPLDRMADQQARQSIMQNTRVDPATWSQGSLLRPSSETQVEGSDFGDVPNAPTLPDAAADRSRILTPDSSSESGSGSTRTPGPNTEAPND